ncbi:hypothetical protein OG552_10940 [Streptomyces sp. NBC_01476]|uniref:hypothetical protein n=1 Tax=Streptomyces sp. NBC_01476 TaxID=2903881 RepID=UPI002E3275F6|nr:hypothetical protein [Streptomyces sp. NBC_01476]
MPGAPGQMLITYHAAPGSASYERLWLPAHVADPVSRTTAPRASPTPDTPQDRSFLPAAPHRP